MSDYEHLMKLTPAKQYLNEVLALIFDTTEAFIGPGQKR